MDVREILSQNSTRLAYCGFVSTILLSIVFESAPLLLLSLISLLLAVAYSKSSHIINPILVRKFGIVLIGGSYRLSENLRVAVCDSELGYKARCAALLIPNLRISGDASKFEEILSKTKFPFEFSISVRELNLKKLIEGFETKRRMKELEIARTPKSRPEEISRLRRELGLIEGELAAISKGSMPISVGAKVSCTASGASESEAGNSALLRVEQLCAIFSATYNIDFRHLSGEELLESIGG
ncbi:MAG: hypothetical protein KGH53_02685 [Candidatus Micrarchaeota archaeon]|nr:hypothetical protein [Candidatus Micrarchaeota archaeon]